MINNTWPTMLPSDFTTYYQFWIKDSVGSPKWSASNGLAATTP